PHAAQAHVVGEPGRRSHRPRVLRDGPVPELGQGNGPQAPDPGAPRRPPAKFPPSSQCRSPKRRRGGSHLSARPAESSAELVAKTANAPTTRTCGARSIAATPWSRTPPSDTPSGGPRPTNARPASLTTTAAAVEPSCTAITPKRFGRTWRASTPARPRPSAVAASTNAASRSTRTCDSASRANGAHAVNAKTIP